MLIRVIAIIAVLVIPLSAAAHGGVYKNVNNSSVVLIQNPLSPIVGESVVFSFTLLDKSNTPLADRNVKLTLIDTFFGDPTKDQEILAREFKTDANGAFEFEYRFEKANYFDVDLEFNDPVTNAVNETGFLVQTRANPSKLNELFQILSLGLLGALTGFLLVKFTRRKKAI
jgi:hypothetical protein